VADENIRPAIACYLTVVLEKLGVRISPEPDAA